MDHRWLSLTKAARMASGFFIKAARGASGFFKVAQDHRWLSLSRPALVRRQLIGQMERRPLCFIEEHGWLPTVFVRNINRQWGCAYSPTGVYSPTGFIYSPTELFIRRWGCAYSPTGVYSPTAVFIR